MRVSQVRRRKLYHTYVDKAFDHVGIPEKRNKFLATQVLGSSWLYDFVAMQTREVVCMYDN